MKILCTADYHIGNWFDLFDFKEKISDIREDYDVVVAAGDLFEANFFNKNNPYRILSKLFPEKFVVAVLGNHEFVKNRYESVIQRLRVEEKCEGGWGVMLDDVLAGFYALMLTLCLKTML